MSALPWDQLPDETDTQYTQFLVYRDMGPKRSIRQAYHIYVTELLESQAPEGPSGAVKNTSTRFRWRERAEAWDIAQLRQYGQDVFVNYVRALRAVADKAADAAEEKDVDDPAWPGILESLDFVARQLKPAMEAGAFREAPAIAHAGAKATPALGPATPGPESVE